MAGAVIRASRAPLSPAVPVFDAVCAEDVPQFPALSSAAEMRLMTGTAVGIGAIA